MVPVCVLTMFTVILNVLLTSVLTVSAQSAVSEIVVRKCCRNGETLYKSQNITMNPIACQLTADAWQPLIYSVALKNFLSKPPRNWKILEGEWPQCGADKEITYVPYSSYTPFIMFDNGSARFGVDPGSTQSMVGEYCADSKATLVCVQTKVKFNETVATKYPRVYRCCGQDAVFSEKSNICVNSMDSHDAPPLLMKNGTPVAEYLSGFPICPDSITFTIVGNVEETVLQDDGSLEIGGIRLPTRQFCVERMKEYGGAGKVFACAEHAPASELPTSIDYRFIMYPVSFIISAVFLGATLIAGWLLPSSHHALHWRCQTHHVVCLMIGDLLMAIIQLSNGSLSGRSCKAIAITTHFFFLAAFFWLNTMCFNIWWTFRDLRPVSLEKGQETRRLRIYACYAWGGPLLIAGLAALFDHFPSLSNNTFLGPRFGEHNCWFFGDTEILTYFFGPIGILLAINVVFFIATARELTCGLWKGEFVKSTTERAALGRVCLKLVVVMGVTWGFDVISWAAGGPNYLWYVTDLMNALQGLFIFMVVGWQPQVLVGLQRLFNRNPRITAERPGNALSSTSHGTPSLGDSFTLNPSTKTAPLETIC